MVAVYVIKECFFCIHISNFVDYYKMSYLRSYVMALYMDTCTCIMPSNVLCEQKQPLFHKISSSSWKPVGMLWVLEHPILLSIGVCSDDHYSTP